MSTNEKQFLYEGAAERKVSIWTDGGGLIEGRITYVDTYSIGFVPDRDYSALGLQTDTESMLYKSFIRAVTPGESTRRRP